MRPEPSDEAILEELVALARGQAPELLPQFGCLVSAHQYLQLYRLWRRFVAPGSEALDWGAGSGHFSHFLVRAGYRATCFSFLPMDFERWMPAGRARLVAGNEREPVRLPFGDASFDAVASVGVLEHVRETGGTEEGSLAEIARVLKPGGMLVCWHFPNRWSWIDVAARRVPGKHRHEFRYSREDVRRLVENAGFELVESARYGVLPRNILHRALGPAKDARWTANLWDALDGGLAVPLGAIAQNHSFVAWRPDARGKRVA